MYRNQGNDFGANRGQGRAAQAQGAGQRQEGWGRGRVGYSKVPLKGLFADGVWYCNCEPRLPASHFQTKNGGKNHGRWFYTCQKPQHQRCKFFLWEDEAKPREAAAVLNNSRSEPEPVSGLHAQAKNEAPRTPNQQYGHNNTITPPRTGRAALRSPSNTASPSPSRAARGPSNTAADEEPFEWPLTGEEEVALTQEVDSAFEHGAKRSDMASNKDSARKIPPDPFPETPKKGNGAGSETLTTPGKRRRSLFEEDGAIGLPTPVTERKIDNPFLTPSTDKTRRKLFTSGSEAVIASPNIKTEFPSSPSATPSPSRFRDVGGTEEKQSELIKEVFGLLEEHDVRLNQATKDALGLSLGKHAVRMQGIAKGRDISRAVIKERDAKIAMLQHRIETLEADRETDKAMIYYLKQKQHEKD